MQKQRKDKLLELLKVNNIEAFLITDPINIKYISGFTGSSGSLIVTMDKLYLFTDFRYVEQAREEAEHIKELEVIKHESPVVKTLKEKLNEFNFKDLYFEKKHITYEQYENYTCELDFLNLVPHDGIIEVLRSQKDESELNDIKKACEIVDLAFSHVLSFIKSGISEKEISLELEYFIKKNGGEGVAFDIIVASGERSSLPHGVASKKIIEPGDLLKMDFGAVYNGYCSDLTRTLILGPQQDKQKEIYNIVLEAQEKALNSIKPGIKGKEADALARNVIRDAGYGDYFGHGLGHGVGLKVHEAPTVSLNSISELKQGMVFTIEPGIYLPDLGGVRIEDTVLLDYNGCTSLTKATKELIIL